jgi:hypothetical protein
MSANFDLGGSFQRGTPAFNSALERRGTLVAWGLALACLCLGAMTAAAFAATGWANGAGVY